MDLAQQPHWMGFAGNGNVDEAEDPITRAMRAADALDRETESLQPPSYDIDLAFKSSKSSRSGAKSISWSVLDFTRSIQESRTSLPIYVGDGYPIVRISSPPRRKRSRKPRRAWTATFGGGGSYQLTEQVLYERNAAARRRDYPYSYASTSRTRGSEYSIRRPFTPLWSPIVPIRTSSKDAPTMLTNSLDANSQDSSQQSEDDMKVDSLLTRTRQTTFISTPTPSSAQLAFAFSKQNSKNSTRTHFAGGLFTEPLQLETPQDRQLALPFQLPTSLETSAHSSVEGIATTSPPIPLHKIHSSFSPQHTIISLPDSPQSLLDSNSIMDEGVSSSAAAVFRASDDAGPTSGSAEDFAKLAIGDKNPEMIVAIGAENGVPKKFLADTIGKINELATTPDGTGRAGKLEMSYLVTHAMQSHTMLPLVQQALNNPFKDRAYMAKLMLPYVESHFLKERNLRFLVITYPPEHLSSALALQALIGNETMKIAGVLNEDDHALKLRPGSRRTKSGKNPAPSAASTSSSNGSGISFAKANYLITASANAAEMAAFLADLADVLIPGSKKDRKRPEVKQTGPPTTWPRRKPVAGHHTAFSSSSNLATPPISPTEPVAPPSPSTTTTHLYFQPVSPDSLDYGRTGPSSAAELTNPIKVDDSTIIFKAVSPDELRRGPVPTSKLSVPKRPSRPRPTAIYGAHELTAPNHSSSLNNQSGYNSYNPPAAHQSNLDSRSSSAQKSALRPSTTGTHIDHRPTSSNTNPNTNSLLLLPPLQLPTITLGHSPLTMSGVYPTNAPTAGNDTITPNPIPVPVPTPTKPMSRNKNNLAISIASYTGSSSTSRDDASLYDYDPETDSTIDLYHAQHSRQHSSGSNGEKIKPKHAMSHARSKTLPSGLGVGVGGGVGPASAQGKKAWKLLGLE